MGERSSHSQTVEGLYPLKDEGGCGRSQLALECHNEQGYQEAEQRSNEVERQGEPLVTGVQRIEASAVKCRFSQLGQLGWQRQATSGT